MNLIKFSNKSTVLPVEVRDMRLRRRQLKTRS